MSVINDLPVLILGYNRLDKFTRCIKTVQKQGIKKVYVSIDGPKNNYDYEIQKRIIDFCSNNNLGIDIKIKNLKKNYGCRIAPIKGITWFFIENKFGVILEDDVIVSNKCMELFSYLLEEHFSNKNLMSISSFNEFTNKEIESIYSIPVFRSWGWATWAEKWKMHLDFSKKIRNLSIWQIYNLLPENIRLIETAEIIKSSQLNLLDAWDYEFNFTHIVNNFNSLTVGGINNFVYGFDKSASHSFDMESLGIDFNLFSEREIQENKVVIYNYKKAGLILNKCGFFYSSKINIIKFINQIIRIFYYSIIFRIRIVKRIIYKRL